MGVSPFSRGRRAKRAWVTDEDSLTPSGTVDEKVQDVVRHSIAGFVIAGLGLAVAGGVALTGAAQASEVSATSSQSISAPDVTRAEPQPQARDIGRDTLAKRQDAQRESQSSNSNNGTLDNYARENGTSRNAIRATLTQGLTTQKAKQRTEALQANGQKATATSRSAVQQSREETMQANNQEIKKEDDRLREEKRKADEARQRAEAAGGSLKDQKVPTYNAPTNIAASGSGGAKPLPSYRISARWGQTGSWSRYHTGIDLAAPIGTPIYAAADGVVAQSNGGGWAGIHVVIRHGAGATLYAHMASRVVTPGTQVKAGQLIGYVGMTGRTFGPHLHLEYYPSAGGVGNPYTTSDPYVFLLSRGVRL